MSCHCTANVGPWIRLAKALNLTVKYWLPTPISPENPFSLHLDPAELAPLIGGHTRLVAFTAKSNLLGHATKVKKAVDLVKEKTGGRGITVVDCVAYSPHDRMDMNKWGCDAVLFSHYKVSISVYHSFPIPEVDAYCYSTWQLFGPHLSSLVISPSSPLSSPSIGSLGHYFHPTSPAYKLAPGGAPYELQIGCSAVLPYLTSLGSVGPDDPETLSEPELVSRAYQRIKAHEKKLSAILLDYLTSEKAKAQGVVVVGPESPEGRAPTISFMVVKKNEGGKYVKAMQSQDIVKVFDEEKKVSSSCSVMNIASTAISDNARPILHRSE
jgi:selenocysteine lyase/cysteine desulfurase